MVVNKKIVMYIVIAVLAIGVATAGTIFALNMVNQKTTKSKTTPTKTSAKSLRDQAEAARKANDDAKSKSLLLEAQAQYKELPKTDETVNAQTDVQAQLWLLEHSGTAK